MGINCCGINPKGKCSEMSEPLRLVLKRLDKKPATLAELEQIYKDYFKTNSLGSLGCLKIYEDYIRFKAHSGLILTTSFTWWHILWDFVSEVGKDILTDEQILLGRSYSGTKINEEQCIKLSEKIEEQINAGYVRKIEMRSKEHYDSLAEIPCPCCEGTGRTQWKIIMNEKISCLTCDGDGIRIHCDFGENWDYISEDNVKTFNIFLKNCGGFVIY